MQDVESLELEPTDGATVEETTSAGSLGWPVFVLQFLSVMLVYLLASIPPVVIFGETSVGMATSVALSMAAALVVAWAWLRRDGAVAQAWDLSHPPEGWPRAIGIALLATVAIIAWFQIGSLLVQQLGFGMPDVSAVMDMVTQSPAHFAMWIVLVAIFAAGIGEELLWRGFLMDRLERLPGLSGHAWAIIGIQAVLFGLPHLYQGWGGVIITGVVGLFFGWLRYNRRGNLWTLIIAHILVDVIMMSAGYAGKLGLIELQ